MKSKISEKVIALFLLMVLLISLIPILSIAKYDYPCADDFSYGLIAHQAWLNSGSIIQTVLAAFSKTAERYMNWQGTYSSIFLMSLQPAVFHDSIYFLTCYIMLFQFSIGTAFFLYELIYHFLKGSRAQACIVFLTLIIVSIQLMFCPVEGIYWYNGAVHYVFMYGCMMITLALTLRFVRTKKIVTAVFACIYALITGGGNYITALTCILCEIVMILFVLMLQRKRVVYALIPMIASIVGLFISGLAPGNQVRQSRFEKASIFGSVMKAFKDGAEFISGNLDVLYILCILLLIPVLFRIVKNTKYDFRLPLLVPLASYCLVSAMFAPTEYTMQISYVGRTANPILFMIQLLGILNVAYFIGYFVKKFPKLADDKYLQSELVFCICIICMFCLSTFCVYRDCKKGYSINYTSTGAIMLTTTGELELYKKEMDERFEILHDDSKKKIHFTALVAKPYLLYFDDIQPNRKDWRNKAMSKYYNKKWIKLKE